MTVNERTAEYQEMAEAVIGREDWLTVSVSDPTLFGELVKDAQESEAECWVCGFLDYEPHGCLCHRGYTEDEKANYYYAGESR